jgi:hypothetical protein
MMRIIRCFATDKHLDLGNPGAQPGDVPNNLLKFVATAVTSPLHSLPATAAHFVGKFGWETIYRWAGQQRYGWC